MENPQPDTEQAIFEAALEVFGRKGRDGARMQEIADRAGINKAMLHYYYRSKDRLYEAVFDYAFARYCAAVSDSVPAEEPIPVTIERFVSRYTAFLSAEPEVMRLFVQENLSGGRSLAAHIQKSRDGDGPPLLPLALKERLASDEGPGHVFLSLLSACVFPFVIEPTVFAMFPAAAEDPERFHTERARTLTQLVLSGMEGTS